MRWRFFLSTILMGMAIVVLRPDTADAQFNIPGCKLWYTTSRQVTDPARPERAARVELRRTDGLPVEVLCENLQIYAREIDWEPADHRIFLRGDVVFQQGGTRIAALLGEVDTETHEGVFESATGTLQLTDRQIDRTLFGSLEPEALFTAARIEKVGPKKYVLTDATFTTCVQPSRRWQVISSKMSFTVDRYAIMRNARLEVKDVPLLYMPVFYYPIQEDDRATGFLMPSYGAGNRRGFTLSNAFFWAINRSHDVTFFHDWFSKSGQGVGAEYRNAGEQGATNVRVHVINEKAVYDDDGTSLITPAQRSYEIRGNLSRQLPGRIRVTGNADFVTSAVTQQIYQTDFDAFTRRSRYFRADASGQWGLIRASATASRNDLFYGDLITSTRTLPSVNVTASQTSIASVGRSNIYVGGSLDAVRLTTMLDLDDPTTSRSIARADGNLYLNTAIAFGPALKIRPSVSVRRTEWSKRQDPASGAIVDEPISRTLLSGQVNITGPTFVKIFNTAGNRWVERLKHVIEPSASIKKVSAFDQFDAIVINDYGVDAVVGGLTQINYGISNKLLGRVRQREGEPVTRELLSLDVSQSYYTDQRAASYDQQTGFSLSPGGSLLPPPSNFSPIRISLRMTPTPTVSGSFDVDYDTQFDAVRRYNASASVTQPWLTLSSTWSKQQVIPGLPAYSAPSHSVWFSTQVRRPQRGASVAYSTAIDFANDRFLQHRLGFAYNVQCCGVAMDYSVRNLSHYGLRNDKIFSLSFNLAGIGSFVNPLGVFGNNGRQ